LSIVDLCSHITDLLPNHEAFHNDANTTVHVLQG
jgi:hypothetical protein